jgi:SAM-dependent methyltransferase
VNWKLKANLLVLLERVPAGPAAYSAVQNLRASRGFDADEMLSRSLDLLALYGEAGGLLPPGRCVEIGTGWCPWLPLLLRLGGASEVLTIDVNPWLSHRTALATTRELLARAERVAPTVGRDPADVRAQLRPLLDTTSLRAWLDKSAIDYRSPADARALDLSSGSVDAVLSSNVLEHVATADLAQLHAEARRVLRPGGLAVHRFNPQDHFAAGDRSITGANFLRYSAAEWRRLGGEGLAPHNRLRCVQHAQLVADAGLEIVVSRTRGDDRARAAIESGALPVHDDFAGMDARQLSDDYMWMAARASSPPAPAGSALGR